ncbi:MULTISPECIES: hypothetical protein [unclassified Methylobacterium]|uniref:hypothetical protein n=1 Tax=unclassified Methylobacterium TaxID=2615210 RepID=UPI0011C1FC92|nr:MULTISPECIES: hypothetical protein [unclassified Methylobacterium]QEE39532.1 hypothetical protein FVA80_11855 [Methylobacterium sp. WL1]TXN05046.1 hypothetical protein FV242_05265 [Methylobacterium sp. WL64]TXN57834.1 hypothetical protein FV241_09360 [Methylobacterium sp. WL2]
MTPFKPQVTGQTRLPMPANDAARDARRDPPAVLLPFPGPDARRTRQLPRTDEQRGEILFFLGVRYERLAS